MNKMKRLVIAVAAFGATTWVSVASAEPAKMTDTQLSSVTAAGAYKINNIAIASNSVSTSGGSASVQCVALCLAVNVPVLSGNIVGSTIIQHSSAKAGTH